MRIKALKVSTQPLGLFFYVQDGYTMYELLIAKADQATYLSNQYRESGDELMSNFWRNAAEGYKLKALNLELGEAE